MPTMHEVLYLMYFSRISYQRPDNRRSHREKCKFVFPTAPFTSRMIGMPHTQLSEPLNHELFPPVTWLAPIRANSPETFNKSLRTMAIAHGTAMLNIYGGRHPLSQMIKIKKQGFRKFRITSDKGHSSRCISNKLHATQSVQNFYGCTAKRVFIETPTESDDVQSWPPPKYPLPNVWTQSVLLQSCDMFP